MKTTTMKKSLLAGIILLFITNNLFARPVSDSLDVPQFKILTLSDSGKMANNLSFYLMLFDYRFKKHDAYTSQYITNSLTVGFDYIHANKYKIAMGASYVNALPTEIPEGVVNTSYPGSPSDGIRNRQHLEFSFTRYFSSHIKEKTSKIKVGKEHGLNFCTNMPYHKLTLIGWNAEVMYYRTSASTEDFNFRAYDVADSKKTIINLPWSYSVVNIDMTWVNIGASITNIVDTRYRMKPYGVRARRHISTIYADIIVAPYIHYSDVQGEVFQYPQTPTYAYRHVNVDEYTPHHRLGCKVGYTYHTNDLVGAGIGAEAGISPGPKFNPYLSIRTYLPIFNVKPE